MVVLVLLTANYKTSLNLIFFLNDENIFTEIFYIKKISKFELNFKNQELNTHFKINIE